MSTLTEDPEFLRQIIVDHYKNPRNFEVVDDPSYREVHMDSASCIDDIFIQVKIVDGIIKEVKWHGTGCAISTASASIMSELVSDKTVKEAKVIMENFENMLYEQDFDEELLGEAISFRNVNRQPSRITCADISYRGLEKIFEELDDEG